MNVLVFLALFVFCFVFGILCYVVFTILLRRVID